MKEIRKVKDGLGRIWYEGFYGESDKKFGTPRIMHTGEWTRFLCRHRWKWLTTRHVNKAHRNALAEKFTDV